MANQKQDGSNLSNAEFHNGRCRTFCEQCFVNFGSRGNCQIRGMLGKEPKNAKFLRDAEKIASTKLKPGDIPAVPYTAPPAVPAETPKPADPNLELLGWKLTKTGKGLLNVPMRAAWSPWIVNGASKGHKAKLHVDIDNFGRVPLILRVSSMSDSSWASSAWVDAIRNAWGEQCFFNSCTKALRERPEMAEHYHKLVVTLNPGKQTMPPIEPTIVRAAWDSPERHENRVRRCQSRLVKEGMSLAAARKECEKRTAVAFEKEKAKRAKWVTNAKAEHYPLNSMGPVRDVAGDFLHPMPISQATGNPSDEDRIKFYRVRALATVSPDIDGWQERLDKPLVVTQMRFVTMGHLVEFCRRYQLHLEINAKPGAGGAKAVESYIAPFQHLEGSVYTYNPRAAENEAYVWTDTNHPSNGSSRRGERAKFVWRANYLRNAEVDGFDHCDYVCDRLHQSCKNCGLCASLDAQGVTVEWQKWTNPYNVMPSGAPWPAYKGRDGAGYIWGWLVEHGYASLEDPDYLSNVLQDMAGATEEELVANPAELTPAHPDVCKAALQQVQAYTMDGIDVDAEFVDGWNTHEDAATVVAFAFWSLLCHGKKRGLGRDATLQQALDAVMDATNGLEVLHAAQACLEMVDNASPWNMQFGPVR